MVPSTFDSQLCGLVGNLSLEMSSRDIFGGSKDLSACRKKMLWVCNEANPRPKPFKFHACHRSHHFTLCDDADTGVFLTHQNGGALNTIHITH